MPTGYTSDLYNGEVSFKDFVLECSKAFGTVPRDDFNSQVPESISVEQYYYDRVDNAERRLAETKNWTLEEASKFASDDFESGKEYYSEKIQENKELLDRYERMLSKVRDWVPPTPQHEKLQSFMIEQLESSIEADVSIDYYTKSLDEIQMVSAEDYKAAAVENNQITLDLAKELLKRQIEKVEDANAWLKALYESI